MELCPGRSGFLGLGGDQHRVHEHMGEELQGQKHQQHNQKYHPDAERWEHDRHIP